MNTNEIMNKYQELSKKLFVALSTMERKDTIFELKNEIASLQKDCPHNGTNFSLQNGCCCFCGKRLTKV